MKINRKDYYKTLGIPSTATAQQIKVAYRRMAMRYHPDRNAENKYADALFRELHEAYNILGNTATRQRYDEERWLNGLDRRAEKQHEITPHWILNESEKLRKYMQLVDTYRMSHQGLQKYVLHLLKDEHLAVLLAENNVEINEKIVTALLQATERLQYHYKDGITIVLLALARSNSRIEQQIDIAYKKSRTEKNWHMSKPIIIVIVTLLIAFAMYLYGRIR